LKLDGVDNAGSIRIMGAKSPFSLRIGTIAYRLRLPIFGMKNS
jgi:hypothetical protein